MTTVQELLTQKYGNFIDFIVSKYPDRKDLAESKNIDIKLIIPVLKEKILPLKHDFSLLMLNMSNEFGFKTSDFNSEEVDKLKRYLKFFIKMMEEIYE